jgi:hypothetical protein
MSLLAEAAKAVRSSCAVRSPSGSCEPTTEISSEKITFMGYVKHFYASIEVWHLNVFSTVVVLLFVYFQFRSMFVARLRPKQLQQESFNQKAAAKQKEFADKQVIFIFFRNFLKIFFVQGWR